MANVGLGTHSARHAPANGLCTRPPQLDCRLESACETSAYFRTGPQFLPILITQRTPEHGQADQAALFDSLIPESKVRPLDQRSPV